MNKHLFKSLQKDKQTELNKLYNRYHRMKSFNDCIYKKQAYDNLTLSQYECFWSWYYNSNVTAKEAYHYTFEDEQSSFLLFKIFVRITYEISVFVKFPRLLIIY